MASTQENYIILHSGFIKYLPSFFRNRLEGRATLQVIVGNSGWLLFDKIVRMGVGLIVSVWVARYLGPEQFGAINFALAFTALFGAFASLGLDGIVVRDIVRKPELKHEILASAFYLKLCGGIFAFVISIVSISVIRPHEGQTHWLVGIIAAGMIFQSFDAIDLWFQSQVQSKFTVISKNTAFIILAVVKVVMILFKASLVAFAWAALFEIIAGALGLVFIYSINYSFSFWIPKKNIALKLMMESWPMILSGLAVMLYMRIDQIMLAQMKGNREVGLYSVALRFSEIWYFIPTIIVSSVMPSLTQAKHDSKERYYILLERLFSLLVKIAYVIALPMTFFSSLLVTSLFGLDYAKSGIILAIHIWSAVFVFLGVGMSPWILNEGFMKYSLFQTFFGLVINIGINLLLIPIYGGIGAAIATLISQMIASFISNAFFPDLRILFKMQAKALVKIN